MTTSDALLMGLLLDTPPINPSGGGGGGSRYTVESLTFSGDLITDAVREAEVEGDGLTPPAGVGPWPAATNLCTNGGFETNTTGWATFTDRTLASSDEQAKFGSRSMKASASATLGATTVAQFQVTIATTTTFTVGFWLYIPSSWTGGNILFQAINYSGATLPGATVANLSLRDQWQRLTYTFTTAADGVGAMQIATQTSWVSGESVYIDGFQLETGSIATPYIETDGFTETRTAGRVQMPVADLFTATQGWVVARVNPGLDSSAISGALSVMDWRDDGNNRLSLRYISPSSLEMTRRNTSGTSSEFVTKNLTAGTPTTGIWAWTSTVVRGSVDGGGFEQTANTLIPTLAASSLDIGSVGGSSLWVDSNILWLVCGAGTLTDDDAAALDAFGDTPPTWAQLVGALPATAQVTGLWQAKTNQFFKAA